MRCLAVFFLMILAFAILVEVAKGIAWVRWAFG